MNKYRFNLGASISILLIVIIITVLCLNMLIPGLSESISVLSRLHSIRSHRPDLKTDIAELTEKKKHLQAALDDFARLQEADLDIITETARKFKLKVSGLSSATVYLQQKTMEKKYELILTGEIGSALDALNYIERNLKVSIVSISLAVTRNDRALVDMNLSMSFGES